MDNENLNWWFNFGKKVIIEFLEIFVIVIILKVVVETKHYTELLWDATKKSLILTPVIILLEHYNSGYKQTLKQGLISNAGSGVINK